MIIGNTHMENIVIESMGIKKAVTTSVTAQIKYEGEIERISLLSRFIISGNCEQSVYEI